MDISPDTIIKISGLITIINPLTGTLMILNKYNGSYKELSDKTLSVLSVENKTNRILRTVMYINGFFGSLMLYLLIDQELGSRNLALLLSVPLLILFWYSSYFIVEDSRKYRQHTISSALLSIYLILLKFVIFFLFDSTISLLLGFVDLAIILSSYFLIKWKFNFWVEMLFGINLSLWVFLIFVVG